MYAFLRAKVSLIWHACKKQARSAFLAGWHVSSGWRLHIRFDLVILLTRFSLHISWMQARSAFLAGWHGSSGWRLFFPVCCATEHWRAKLCMYNTHMQRFDTRLYMHGCNITRLLLLTVLCSTPCFDRRPYMHECNITRHWLATVLCSTPCLSRLLWVCYFWSFLVILRMTYFWSFFNTIFTGDYAVRRACQDSCRCAVSGHSRSHRMDIFPGFLPQKST